MAKAAARCIPVERLLGSLAQLLCRALNRMNERRKEGRRSLDSLTAFRGSTIANKCSRHPRYNLPFDRSHSQTSVQRPKARYIPFGNYEQRPGGERASERHNGTSTNEQTEQPSEPQKLPPFQVFPTVQVFLFGPRLRQLDGRCDTRAGGWLANVKSQLHAADIQSTSRNSRSLPSRSAC